MRKYTASSNGLRKLSNSATVVAAIYKNLITYMASLSACIIVGQGCQTLFSVHIIKLKNEQ